MPHTWSTVLRPVVASLALVVVALMIVCVPAPAEAKRKRSVPPPPAVELDRVLAALGHLDPEIRAKVAALRRVERRLAVVDRRLADLARAAAVARSDDARLAVLDARRAKRLAERARLVRERGYARDLIAGDRAARRVVLRALPLDLRQRALRRAARARHGERRAERIAVPFVVLATQRPAVRRADTTPPAPSGLAAVALAYALTQVGTPYRTAGESPGGYDCSGLLWWAFRQAGLGIPRSSGDIYDFGVRVSRRHAAPGDIVSFHGEGHVGLYLGGGLYVHSTRTGDVVRVSPLADRSDLDGFVRIDA